MGERERPGRSRWDFDRDQWPESDAIAVGGDLNPATIVAAYEAGAFPMPHDGQLLWWSPMQRGVLDPDALHVSRSLRRSARHLHCTYDEAFDEVIDACAEPSRPGGWISDEIRDAYRRLHELGWAHSIETRDADGQLVGGLYGLQVGRLFAGESMFHRVRDASKVALVALADLQRGGLIDVQWSTPHLASLGVVQISRPVYLERLDAVTFQPAPEWPVTLRNPPG